MKRKLAVCVLGTMTAAALVLSGCGATGSSASNGSVTANETAADYDEADVTAYYESDEVEVDPEYEDDVSYTEKQSIALLKGDTAVYKETTTYSYGMTADYSYEGTYTQDENVIVFSSNSGDVQTITLDDNGKIISVEYSYGGYTMEDITGTYTCESDEYGTVTLEIDEDYYATVTMADGSVYNGAAYQTEDAWELVANDGVSSDIDWILTFDGDTFTYQTYGNKYYGSYEGIYECTGDLGVISVTVDTNGVASADVTIEGTVRHLEGSVYADTDDESVSGFYLYDAEGYSLDMTITQLEDGTLNYSGSYSVPLAAG